MWPHRGSLSRVGSLVMSSERQRPGGSKRSRGALDRESGATNPCHPLDVSLQGAPAVRVKLSLLEWVACDNKVWRRASTQNASGMPSCATSLGLRRCGLVIRRTGHLCGTSLAPRWSVRSQAAEWS